LKLVSMVTKNQSICILPLDNRSDMKGLGSFKLPLDSPASWC